MLPVTLDAVDRSLPSSEAVDGRRGAGEPASRVAGKDMSVRPRLSEDRGSLQRESLARINTMWQTQSDTEGEPTPVAGAGYPPDGIAERFT